MVLNILKNRKGNWNEVIALIIILAAILNSSHLIADGLNPLMISHTARAISKAATGSARIPPQKETWRITPDISNKAARRIRVAPIRPNVAMGRGTSRDI